jgi:hypothetical protein
MPGRAASPQTGRNYGPIDENIMTTPTTRNLLAVLTLFTALTACTSLPGTTTSPPSAQTVVTQLAQHIPTTTPGVTYTADTDSNHLLGRPNGYLSKQLS